MKNANFVHLHVHNEYSVLDGVGTSKRFAQRCQELGFKALALTNHGNIDGTIEHQKQCLEYNIKPIAGAELYVVDDMTVKTKNDRRGHITALVKNKTGWQNLCHLLTQANMVGFYYKPRVDFDLLLERSRGLVLLTGCAQSFIQTLKRGNLYFEELCDVLGDDLYLEVMPHRIDIQHKINNYAYQLHRKYKVPLVATNDCHYPLLKDHATQAFLTAIQSRQIYGSKDAWKFGLKGLFLRSVQQMRIAFKKQESLSMGVAEKALRNTLDVAEKCWDFRINRIDVDLPEVQAKPNNETDDSFLLHLCYKGLKKRGLYKKRKYRDRLRSEYKLVVSKKFSRYFLLVWELVDWCKRNDIMVGPGRGSVGGSLMAYALGITSVDPIKYGLLFSRFISVDRIDYPDIDLDFEDHKRHLVRQHLAEVYGHENVTGIGTFIRMKGKACIRDVGRTLDLDSRDVDSFASVIDDAVKGTDEGLIQRAIDETDIGKEFAEAYPEAVKFALALEGQIKAYGQHAAAIVVSADPLTDSIRGNLALRSNNVVINWEGNNAEYMGLLKLDTLGLKTMSVLNEARKLILENHGDNIDFEKLSLNDKRVYQEMTEGHNVGIFQVSGFATNAIVGDLVVDSIHAIADLIALSRPGPSKSGMTAEFIQRKHGKKWKPLHPKYEQITKNTYGLIVYQEQVMSVINKVGGLPYKTADKIRKIIGKKRDPKEFKQFKDAFVKGCKKQGTLNKREANEFWAAMEKHAGYSFNLSHSIEYAIIAYWTMWLKVHYPAEFICSSLSYSNVSREDLIEEAFRLGLSIQTPKVGISKASEWIVKDNKLYVPFIEVKGVGPKTAEKIMESSKEKEKGFKGFYSSLNNDEPKQLSFGKKTDTILEEIGAFQNTTPDTAQKYFDFKISGEVKLTFPNLFKYIRGKKIKITEDVVMGKQYVPGVIRNNKFSNKRLLHCTACDLVNECTSPVMPSNGRTNVVIAGEAPGKDEDKDGEGFVGRAGDILWDELEIYGLKRSLFHVTNIVKCWPSATKTPTKHHIETCSRWIDEELQKTKTKLILAFGNTCLKYFTGKPGGITKVNAQTQWSEEHQAWICWCMHPASVLHNPDNKQLFRAGIKNFAETYKIMKGK